MIAEPRRYWFTFLLGLAVLAGAVGFSKLVMRRAWFERPQGRVARERQILNALPQIARKDGRTVVIVGSSQVALGLSPIVFDGALHELGVDVTSYNLALIGAASPTTQLMATRVHDAYLAAGRKAALSLVQFSPQLTTRKVAKLAQNRLGSTRLHTPATLRAFGQKEPDVAMLGFLDKYVLFAGSHDIGADDVVDSIKVGLFGEDLRWCFFHPYAFTDVIERQRPLLASLCQRVAGHFPSGYFAWQPEERGYIELDFPDTRDDYRRLLEMLRTPQRMAETAKNYQRDLGVIELDIDPGLLASFVDGVRSLRQVSDHVIVFVGPESKWIKHTPEAADRMSDAFRQIEEASGAPVIDLRATGVDDDFFDTMHVNCYPGAQAFSRRLAERVHEVLGGTDSAR